MTRALRIFAFVVALVCARLALGCAPMGEAAGSFLASYNAAVARHPAPASDLREEIVQAGREQAIACELAHQAALEDASAERLAELAREVERLHSVLAELDKMQPADAGADGAP